MRIYHGSAKVGFTFLLLIGVAVLVKDHFNLTLPAENSGDSVGDRPRSSSDANFDLEAHTPDWPVQANDHGETLNALHSCSCSIMQLFDKRVAFWKEKVERESCEFKDGLCDKVARSKRKASQGTEMSQCTCKLIADREAEYLHWRKLSGSLSCKYRGVGPTGGFCLQKGKKVHDNSCLNGDFARALSNIFKKARVLDLGCGVGHYGAYFRKNARSVGWIGIDGAEQIEDFTKGFVRFADLSQGLPLEFQRSYDFMMSIEVAEHIPRFGEGVFVHNLVRWAAKGIIVSWALPGQRGHYHVNCQPVAYVRCVMGLFGWVTHAEAERGLQGKFVSPPSWKGRKQPCWWIGSSLHVFRKGNTSVDIHRAFRSLPTIPDDAFIQNYLNVTEALCHPEVNGCAYEEFESQHWKN